MSHLYSLSGPVRQSHRHSITQTNPLSIRIGVLVIEQAVERSSFNQTIEPTKRPSTRPTNHFNTHIVSEQKSFQRNRLGSILLTIINYWNMVFVPLMKKNVEKKLMNFSQLFHFFSFSFSLHGFFVLLLHHTEDENQSNSVFLSLAIII